MPEERSDICSQLEKIKDDPLKQLVQFYYLGNNAETFWQIVSRASAFESLREILQRSNVIFWRVSTLLVLLDSTRPLFSLAPSSKVVPSEAG